MSKSLILERILNNSTFYRNAFRKTGWLVLISTFISLGIAGYITLKIFNPEPPVFIICTVDGRMIPVDSLTHKTRL